MKHVRGFTLLEVLVAMAVLAIAMGAIIRVATQSINNTAYLREQTFAGWVALNQVNELLLDPTVWPDGSSRKGTADLANRAWRWEARFSKTDDPDLRRLDIVVRAGENGPISSTLTAFMGRPPPKPPPKDQSTKDQLSKDQPPRDQPPKGRSSSP
ncbi:MAG: type II secretion system minor pseudopilin GspI [Candidatus Competibacteraceae bacterium]